jgi:predicted phosphodiesterase
MVYKYRRRGYCWNCGRRTSHRDNNNNWFCLICEKMTLEKTLTDEEKNILRIIRKRNLTSREFSSIVNTSRISTSGKPYSYSGKKMTIGVFSDTHIGNKCYDRKLMDYAAERFNEKDVDFVIFGGDLCEGHYESKRQGSVFELEFVGGDAQVKEAIKELKKIKKPIYGITGNHETNTFFKMSGFDIGEQIQDRLKNFHYLGQGRGVINLPYGQKIEIVHPDGGSSYAISYKSQKIAESLEGGTKPAVLFISHYHKAEYLFYRNIHIIQTGCLESQTDYERNHHISVHKGFWVVDLEIGKEGVSKITPTFYPAY